MANPTYITASENPLFKVFNFTNESISQLEYPIFYNVSSNFNLSILSNNLASFTFNATNPTVAYAFALSSVILNEDAIRLPVNCIYVRKVSVLFIILIWTGWKILKNNWILLAPAPIYSLPIHTMYTNPKIAAQWGIRYAIPHTILYSNGIFACVSTTKRFIASSFRQCYGLWYKHIPNLHLLLLT